MGVDGAVAWLAEHDAVVVGDVVCLQFDVGGVAVVAARAVALKDPCAEAVLCGAVALPVVAGVTVGVGVRGAAWRAVGDGTAVQAGAAHAYAANAALIRSVGSSVGSVSTVAAMRWPLMVVCAMTATLVWSWPGNLNLGCMYQSVLMATW